MTITFQAGPPPPSKGPKVLFILGGIALVLGVALATIGAVLFGSGLVDTVNDLSEAREKLDAEVPVPGSTEVYLQPETYDVVAIGNGLVRQVDGDNTQGSTLEAAEFNEPTVTVTTIEGQPMTLRSPRGGALVSVSGYDMVSLSSFEVVTAGTYVIKATGEPGPVTTVGVGQASRLNSDAITRAVGGGILFGLGIVLFVPGTLFLIGGCVWLFVDRWNRRPPPPPGGPAAGGPPAGGPPGPPPGWPPAGPGWAPPGGPSDGPGWPPPGRPSSPPPLPPAGGRRPPGPGNGVPADSPTGRPPTSSPPWEPPQSPIS